MKASFLYVLLACTSATKAQEPSLSALLELSELCRTALCVDSFAVRSGFGRSDTTKTIWSSTYVYRYGDDKSLGWLNTISYDPTDLGYIILLTTFDRTYAKRLMAEVKELGYPGPTHWGKGDYFQHTYRSQVHPGCDLTCFLYTSYPMGRSEPVWGFSFFVKH
jgi:hypothetical protein